MTFCFKARSVSILTALIVAFSTPAYAERDMGAFGDFKASVSDGFTCQDTVDLTVRASQQSSFNKTGDLSTLMEGTRIFLEGECPNFKAIRIAGKVGNDIVYKAVTTKSSDWQIIGQSVSAAAPSQPPAQTSPNVEPIPQSDSSLLLPGQTASTTADSSGGEGGLDRFKKALQENESKPKTTSTVSSTDSSGSISTVSSINLYCSGNINRYTGSQFMETKPFEFRTLMNIPEKKHKVINVLKGFLFRSGSTYNVTDAGNGMYTLNAESNNSRYSFTSLQLDTAVGKITGKGGVSFDKERSMLGELVGKRMSTGGLDGMRRAEVDGACTVVD